MHFAEDNAGLKKRWFVNINIVEHSTIRICKPSPLKETRFHIVGKQMKKNNFRNFFLVSVKIDHILNIKMTIT